MKIVKVKKAFYDKCVIKGTADELLFNESGRPCVLLIHMKYKNKLHQFIVPFRSNISDKTPNNQYFHLPPNKNTKKNHSHGLHYIKIFPITDKYIDKYRIEGDSYWKMIQSIVDENEVEIINACKDYLQECEKGNKHYMTPNIDGILSWLYEDDK